MVPQAPQANPQEATWRGRVVRVVDGDTVEVTRPAARGCLTIQRVRVANVDAPERRQSYGDHAALYTSMYLFNYVVNVKVIGKDRYGRWIADLCRGKSPYRCVSYRLVRDGWAWWYKEYAPNDKRLQRAEEKARREKKGLWKEKNPVPPWEWRRKRRR